MFASLLNLIRDDERTTTVEWIVVGTLAVLIVGAACKIIADKGTTEAADLSSGWDDLQP